MATTIESRTMTTARDHQIDQFLKTTDWKESRREAMRPDASARQYFRLTKNGKSAILMDAAPPFEEVGTFRRKAEIFRHYGWRIPNIFACDETLGLLILEDFGDVSFATLLADGGDAGSLYNDAIDNLIHLHRQDTTVAKKLPHLDDGRLVYLATWLIEWYVPMVQPQNLSRVIRERFIELWMDAFSVLRHVPMHAAHLDFQFHNLMRCAGKTAIEKCGVLDFQDACFAPITADLVLLLQNAREDVQQTIVESGLKRYLDAFPKISRDDFHASFAAFSAHNAMRILGLFARLKMRDGKGQYLQHIPRNLKYLEQSLKHPALAPIREWFDTHVPTEKRLAIPGLRAA